MKLRRPIDMDSARVDVRSAACAVPWAARGESDKVHGQSLLFVPWTRALVALEGVPVPKETSWSPFQVWSRL